MKNIINMVPELNKESVVIKNREHVNSVIENIIKSGAQQLQVVADFDFTLTKYLDKDGVVCDSTHRSIERSTVLPPKFQEQTRHLSSIYYPIEVDPKLTIAEKTPFMVEWWKKAHAILIECCIRKDQISEMVKQSRIMFRDGCDWLFAELDRNDVPLLIFSAGVGDIINETMEQRSHFYDNMRIVSNFMDFNDQGVLIGFKGELLHVFNKNEHSIHKSDYFEKIRHRDSVILLGDSLGDLRITEGAQNCTNLLKIGFLNDKIEARLQEYSELFDIVLVSEQSMDVVNAIMRQILPSVKN